MDVVALTRQLVDTESITGNEGRWAISFMLNCSGEGFNAEKIPVEGARCNVFAVPPEQPRRRWFSPPTWIRSRPSSRRRGCFAGLRTGLLRCKGIIASQVEAAERLRLEGIHVGLLFVVGEERDSLGCQSGKPEACGL